MASSSSSPSEVRELAQRLERSMHRENWQHDRALASQLRDVLTQLSMVKVDVPLLRATNLGRLVHQVAKYDDDVVHGYSKALKQRWKAELGVAKDKPNERKTGPTLADAKRRLQQTYKEDKERRQARAVQVLAKPVAPVRGRASARKVVVSTAPKKWSAMQTQRRPVATKAVAAIARRAGPTPTSGSLNQHLAAGRKPIVRALPTPSSSSSRSLAAERPKPRRPVSAGGRTTSTSTTGLDPAEIHRRRQERLRAAAQVQEETTRRPDGHRSSGNRTQASPRVPSPAAARSPDPVDPRKALLDRLVPRVCGTVAELPSATSKRAKTPTGGGGRPASGKQKKPVQLSEGEREVLQWLKGLDVDMSQYAPSFFDKGFDSIKLLREVKPRDLEGMVPKVGHQRMIEKALEELKRQFLTSAATVRRQRPHSVPREAKRRPLHRDPFEEEDSDDSFVVSDGEDYYPGAIANMMFRQSGRHRKRALSVGSVESDDMEASFDQIQREEERSKRIGDYEDYREELRNEKLLKKKKKT